MSTFLKRHGFTIGYCWAVIGAVMFIAGLGLDLRQHASETEEAAERVFDTGTVGHLLAILGIYNLAAGLILAGFSRWVLGRMGRASAYGLVALPVALGAAVTFGVMSMDTEIAVGHSH